MIKKSVRKDIDFIEVFLGVFSKSLTARNLTVLKIDHRFKPPQRNPLKPPTTLSASAAGGSAIVALPQRRNPKGKRPNLRGGFILFYIILSDTVIPFRALRIKK
ncbi:hypothetical protein [Gilliamella sp. Pas-s27]|uniref:hypothetical protein n=1 Tax=Gilliamella sp. Pas-s27 TaxID=2687311 RepID=UPI00136601BC|nr:hypothetical protein [Gilliamella sp. Pas-s27]MWP46317.1 hypothetical protein [Gilliamella sp. Pas-s27]